MKAAIVTKYGPPDVIDIQDVPKPKISDSEILVKVKAVAVTAADSRIRGARFPKGFGLLSRMAFGLAKPRVKILGSAFSGIVDEVGSNVTQFKVGDEVCGMNGIKMGANAEYIRIKKFRGIAKKPSKVTHTDAAGVLFGGTAALYFLRDKLHVSKGETAVINGASGAVGTNAVQLAYYFGATVTGVTSGDNAKLIQKLGAKDIIDYTKEDLLKSGQKFDVVLDAVGNLSPSNVKILLAKTGRAGLMVPGLATMLQAHGSVKVGGATEKKEDIEFLLELVSQKKLKVVIDKIYDFDQIVEAHKHVDGGKKVGNVVIVLK